MRREKQREGEREAGERERERDMKDRERERERDVRDRKRGRQIEREKRKWIKFEFDSCLYQNFDVFEVFSIVFFVNFFRAGKIKFAASRANPIKLFGTEPTGVKHLSSAPLSGLTRKL